MSKKMVVECIETGEQFPSIVEAARAKGCSAPNISKALQKGTIAAGGHWRYKFPKSEVMKTQKTLCNACRSCGPMSDGTGVDWCSTCPVLRIKLG